MAGYNKNNFKPLLVTKEVYNMLKNEKKEGESFGQTIKRLIEDSKKIYEGRGATD